MFEQKPIQQEHIYQGAVFNVRKDLAQMHEGKIVTREVVEHRGGVAIAMEREDGSFFLVRQWRYAQAKLMLEFPAGKKEIGEDPFTTAQREIQEETGYQGVDWQPLGQLVPTPAYDTEVIHLYYCKQGKFVGQHLDEDEELQVEYLTSEQIIDLVRSGEIDDAKTMAMAYMVKDLQQQRENKS